MPASAPKPTPGNVTRTLLRRARTDLQVRRRELQANARLLVDRMPLVNEILRLLPADALPHVNVVSPYHGLSIYMSMYDLDSMRNPKLTALLEALLDWKVEQWTPTHAKAPQATYTLSCRISASPLPDNGAGVRAAWAAGLDPDVVGVTPGGHVLYRAHDCRGIHVKVELDASVKADSPSCRLEVIGEEVQTTVVKKTRIVCDEPT